jgi:hypothetical protein
MDNPEKLSVLGTQRTRRRQTKQKHSTICVGHHYTRTSTNIVTKTRSILKQMEVYIRTEHQFYTEIVTDITT